MRHKTLHMTLAQVESVASLARQFDATDVEVSTRGLGRGAVFVELLDEEGRTIASRIVTMDGEAD